MAPRSENCYLVQRESTGNLYVMVPDPDTPGRYMMTSICVAYEECPACGSPVGVPCMRATGRWGTRVCPERNDVYSE